jgi:hypothetical protein
MTGGGRDHADHWTHPLVGRNGQSFRLRASSAAARRVTMSAHSRAGSELWLPSVKGRIDELRGALGARSQPPRRARDGYALRASSLHWCMQRAQERARRPSAASAARTYLAAPLLQ